MGFMGHLDELRARLMRSLYIFVAGFGLAYFVSEPVMAWLRAPLFAALPEDKRFLYFTSLFENFMTHLKIAGYLSFIVLSPYFFFQLWAFISPGLKAREKRLVVPFVFAGALFFIAGALFAYYVLFPVGFKYFVTYGGPNDLPMLTIDAYYTTCMKLMALFGLGFQLPVGICLLGALGLVDAVFLKQHRRGAIIGITVLSALFAPPDAVSMLILMAPLILMYEGSILVVQAMNARRQPSEPHRSPNEEPENALRGESKY
jgi:sec-independent protein translocase protein TatC